CGPAEIVTRPESLVRAVLAASQHLPAGTLVVPVPLAPRPAGALAASPHRASPPPAGQTPAGQPPAGPCPDADLCAAGIVAAAYGATHLLADAPDGAGLPSGSRNGALTVPGVPIPVISAGEWAYDPRSEVWRPLA